MFNYSFSEIALVALVALIAIGPERLPRVARGAGILFGRFRRYAATVKDEIDNELQKAQLKEVQDRIKEAHQEAQSILNQSQQHTTDFLNSPVASQENTIHAVTDQHVTEPITNQHNVGITTIAIVGVAGDPYSVRAKPPTRSQPIKSPQFALSLDETPPTEAS